MASISSLLRSALVSITALALLPAAAAALPRAPDVGAAAAFKSGPDKPILVWQGEGRDRGPGYRFWPRTGGRWAGRGWGGNWNGGRYWNRGGGYGWRHGGYGRHGGYYRNGWNNWGGFALGLGLGIPLGYYGSGYYGGYDYDPYYYDEPVYRPRVYRPRVRRAAPYYAEPRVYRYPRAQTGSQCDNVYLRGRNFSGCFDNR